MLKFCIHYCIRNLMVCQYINIQPVIGKTYSQLIFLCIRQNNINMLLYPCKQIGNKEMREMKRQEQYYENCEISK